MVLLWYLYPIAMELSPQAATDMLPSSRLQQPGPRLRRDGARLYKHRDSLSPHIFGAGAVATIATAVQTAQKKGGAQCPHHTHLSLGHLPQAIPTLLLNPLEFTR